MGIAHLSLCLTPTLQRTLTFANLRKGEVNRTSNYRLDASGKGINVTRVLLQLGKEATHLTHLGGDQREAFLRLCDEDELDIRWVESESPIRTCYTVLDTTDATTTELVEEAAPVGPGTEERLRGAYEELLPSFDVVIISGNKSAGYSQEIVPWLVDKAKAQGKNVIADFRGSDLLAAIEHRPDIIKPNFTEFASTFLSPKSSSFGPERARGLSEHTTPKELERAAWIKMKELAELGIGVILTRGSQETLYAFPGDISGHHAPIRVDPVNTIGCGDAFTAGFAAEWADSGDIHGALEAAHAAASMNAVKLRPGVIRG